jgi:hypothetical protein
MDENEIMQTIEVGSAKHNRWSVLILTLNWATQVVEQTAQTLEGFTMMAAQHANHVKDQDNFLELTKHWEK